MSLEWWVTPCGLGCPHLVWFFPTPAASTGGLWASALTGSLTAATEIAPTKATAHLAPSWGHSARGLRVCGGAVLWEFL